MQDEPAFIRYLRKDWDAEIRKRLAQGLPPTPVLEKLRVEAERKKKKAKKRKIKKIKHLGHG